MSVINFSSNNTISKCVNSNSPTATYTFSFSVFLATSLHLYVQRFWHNSHGDFSRLDCLLKTCPHLHTWLSELATSGRVSFLSAKSVCFLGVSTSNNVLFSSICWTWLVFSWLMGLAVAPRRWHRTRLYLSIMFLLDPYFMRLCVLCPNSASFMICAHKN